MCRSVIPVSRFSIFFLAFVCSIFSFRPAKGQGYGIPTRDYHLALGNPSGATSVSTDSFNYLVSKSQFALSYNAAKGTPNWVSWHLSSAWKGTSVRCNCFTPDSLLPSFMYRVSTSNYTGTGFDRGHLCPSDDRDGSDSDNTATFVMTNIMPQAPNMNQVTWGGLEGYSRTLLNRGKELYIIAGGYGSGGSGSGSGGGITHTIASGRISVPSHYWKIIIELNIDTNDVNRVTTSTRAIAVLMPNNQSVSSHTWDYYRVSIDSIEALTGYDFLSRVDTSIQRVIEARTDDGETGILAWDFTGANNVATWRATTISNFLDTASGAANITRGGGAGASTGANSFRTTGFQNNGIATSNTDYFQVRLKAKTGSVLSLSSIDAHFNGTSSFHAAPGVAAQFAYSLNGSTFTLIDTPFYISNPYIPMNTIVLSGIPALQNLPATQTVYFRYYASGRTTTGGWGFYSYDSGMNGLSFGGTLSDANPIVGPSAVCVGATATLSVASASGVWSSSNTGVATIGSSAGILTGIAPGTATITFLSASGVDTFSKVITVDTTPVSGVISGASSVITGAVITLSASVLGGSWTSSSTNATVAGGVVRGISAGTTTISYTVSNSCGVANATHTVNVSLPIPDSIHGPSALCVGATATFSATATGGTWSVSHPAKATVNATTGVVTGYAAGTTLLSYTYSGGRVVNTITVLAAPGAIAGTSVVCQGSVTTLSASGSGGTWYSSNGAIASVVAGRVNGVTAGSATITYVLATGCVSTRSFTVSALPAAISGASTLCLNQTSTLSNTAIGGTWSSSNPTIASVAATSGIVRSFSVAGYPTITYTMPGGCSVTVLVPVVNLAAIAGGSGSVCAGRMVQFTNSTSGGAWSTAVPSVATIGTTGRVTGVAPGSSVISYSLNSGCVRTTTIVVRASAAVIAGATSVCQGETITLSNSVAGGTWSSLSSTIASVGSGTGVVTGVLTSSVAAKIVYVMPASCNDTAQIMVVRANPITGLSAVCQGRTITLYNATSGGSWSSSNAGVASIHATTGILSGLSAGTVTITYTNSGGCAVTKSVSVSSFAEIAGPTTVCQGATITLTNPIVGGTWSIYYPTIATIGSSSGIVTGIAGSGTTNYVTYTLPGGCVDTARLTVQYSAPITGPGVVCPGSTINLSNIYAGAGGTWSSSDPSVATVTGYTAVVTGVASGTTTVSYTLPGGCSALRTVSVHPTVADITGPPAVCRGFQITLSSVTAGGIWTSQYPFIAAIGSASGIVIGLLPSSVNNTITYTIPATGCRDTAIVRVNGCARDGDGAEDVGAIANQSLELFPNPSNGTFTIDGLVITPLDAEVVVAMRNIVGQVVYSHTFHPLADETSIVIPSGNNLAAGMYIVSVQVGGQQFNLRHQIN